MNPKNLIPGDTYVVICTPPFMSLPDGGKRGFLAVGEVLEYDYSTYNSYDGFFMVFFRPSKDGTERVWIGNYSETEKDFFDRWENFFEKKV